MPYGAAPKPKPHLFNEAIEESSEGKMGKMGRSLQLCPIWVLREGENKPQPGEGTAKVCAPKQSAKHEQQDMEVSIECEEVSSERISDGSSPSKKMEMKKK